MYRKQVRRRRAVLVALVVVCLMLISLSISEADDGPLHSIQNRMSAVLNPIGEGASRALKPGDTDEWDVGEVIRTLLADFPAPEEQWAQLPAGVSRRLRLGLELATANQGLSLAPDICAWLGQRGITVELDIYRADERPR